MLGAFALGVVPYGGTVAGELTPFVPTYTIQPVGDMEDNAMDGVLEYA